MLNRYWVLSLVCLLAACADRGEAPPSLQSRAEMVTAVQFEPERSAQSILVEAHKAAGGEDWSKPQQLKLSGYSIIRGPDKEVIWDRYSMWRIYARENNKAKVRLEAWSGDELALLMTYDGKKAYDQDGPMTNQRGSHVWGNSYGFGAIRSALDDGWKHKRLPDDLVDGKPTYMIELASPSGQKSVFGIRQSDYAIVYAGFNTRRAWHERRYSHFFSKPGVSWRQPGRIRNFYNGVKADEVVWLDFELEGEWSEDLFRVTSENKAK